MKRKKENQGRKPGLKESKKSAPQNNVGAAAGSVTKAKPMDRRDFMTNVGIYGALGAAVIGGGWYFADWITASAREGDLTKIGNGIPAVVQIHDPTCPLCTALQKESRDAINNMDTDGLQFLVANIRSDEGRALATEHGVGHVTLLLFDGDGRRRMILEGSNTADALQPIFERFAKRHSR